MAGHQGPAGGAAARVSAGRSPGPGLVSGRTAAGLALVIATAVLVAPWTGHVDDTDAQLYQVVARHMAEDHSWFALRYLPGVHPHFWEHLPFGLWPWAAAIRLVGERALAPLAGLFTLGTLLVVGWVGRRLGGWATATVAILVLGTTESFIIYGGRPRLDPLLLLLVAASLAPVLAWPPDRRRWLLGALFAAGAALVKGPFGLVPFLAAGMVLAWEQRSTRWFARALGFTGLAAAPVVLFLGADRLWGSGNWWNGYVVAQVLASATGGRFDGLEPPWFPLATIATRFWPGLPLVALGLGRAAGWPRMLDPQEPPTPRVARRLALFSLLVLTGLAIPERKVWHHALVAYPGLALLAAVGTAPVLRRWVSSPGRRRAALATLAALAALAVGFVAVGGGARVWKRCVHADEFSAEFDRLRPGEPVLVVSEPPHWRIVAGLAAERRLEPWMENHLAPGLDHGARLALVEGHLLPPAPLRAPWRWVGAARGWVLLRRE
jgi:4-amino-4-deoxy-L-arabinose transferase-like glycosyltransferase